MTSEDKVEDPLMCVQFCIKGKVFSFCVTVYLLFSILTQETPKSLFLPSYNSLELNHDTNYLMTSEDTVEDPLMCVQFCIKGKVFSFRVKVYLLFSFILQETFKSVILGPYD